MKVLIVEDNEDSRNLLMKQLGSYGYEITAAANGVEALEQALAQPPDIIVSDILMPEMDGFQLCHECKQSKQLKNTPFVFYTATYTREEDQEFAMSLGANGFFTKPAEPDTFAQMLSEIVKKVKSGLQRPPETASLKQSLFLSEYNKRIVAKLEEKVAQLEKNIVQRRQAQHSLSKRMKELQCLYSLSVLERQNIPSEEMFQKVVDLLPIAWQYPEITCARVIIDDQEFSTKNFRETLWKQTNDILVHGRKVGSVEVFYLEERAKIDEGPFLKEERALINSIVEQLARVIEGKQTQNSLSQSEKHLRNIYETTLEAIIITDAEGKITSANPASMKIFMCDDVNELIGREVTDLYVYPEQRLEWISKAKLVGYTENIELTIKKRDGTHGYVLANINLLTDEYGNVTGAEAFFSEITELKKTQTQLIIRDRLASIGELVSGVAHELNNPMTGIIGLSDLLLAQDVSDDVREDLELINKEAKRTADIVKGLLTFARKQTTEKQPVDINKVIQAVLDLRAYEQKLSNIEVNTHFSADLPEIIANSSQLRQVFLNMMVNAEQAMLEAHNKGILTVTSEQVGNIVRISFTDDGPGITQENLGHLFEPFFTTKEEGKGTGLGLSISYGIITDHDGRIYAESELDKGATFVIELPLDKQ